MNTNSILVIDDDEIILNQLNKYLKNFFFNKIYLAKNGNSAMEIFEKEEIDIISIDIRLPDMDGFQLIEKLREKDKAFEIIVITGYGSHEIAIQSVRNGAIDYIEKPVQVEDLYTAIGRAREKINKKKKILPKDTILLISIDAGVIDFLKKNLIKRNLNILTADNVRDVNVILENNKVNLIITDMKLNDVNCMDLLKKTKSECPDIEYIIIYEDEEYKLPVTAFKTEIFDYIQKPVNLKKLLFLIEKAIEKIRLYKSDLFRNRELKISSEIIFKINEELEKKYEERTNELIKTQAQLFQTSKLATLGEMSAGLAHEMNQPLGGIALVTKNLWKLMDIEKLTDEEIKLGLKDIDLSVKRMNKIIQHIRTFARQDTLQFINVNINETIDSALNLINEQLRLHEIYIEKDYDSDLPLIKGEPYQLEQVWINILTNARDALDEKVRLIDKKILLIKDYKKKITISTRRTNEKGVNIEFNDNGIGMKNEIMEKAFQPFFTTKEVGKATGLGLSISYGIIESHKGKIEIASEDNKGTSVNIVLKEDNGKE